MKILLAALVILPTLVHAEEDQSWILLQRQANGGIGKIVHDLTERECTVAHQDIAARQVAQHDAAFTPLFTPIFKSLYQEAITHHPECTSIGLAPADGIPAGIEIYKDAYKDASRTLCLLHVPDQAEPAPPIVHHDTDITSADCFQ